jgi:hypothetical protein
MGLPDIEDRGRGSNNIGFLPLILEDVQQADLIFHAPFLEPFRDVCGNRYGGATHLRCQPKEFILREPLSRLV